MGKKLDDFVQTLQEQIYKETRSAYGELVFDRWLKPPNVGSLNNPDGYAILTGVCGDTMQIFLRFEKDLVKEATFLTDGCGSSVACGSLAAELALGKDPDALLEVTGEKIISVAGKLPKEDEHCAHLAAETLQEALNDYMIKQRKKET
jgi:nitrogen fixation NifU-like protein